MAIYAGTSAFFANRSGKHDWRDNHKRPFLSVINTAPDGTKNYTDLFLNMDPSIEVKATKTKVTITFPADTNQPLFRVLAKGDQS